MNSKTNLKMNLPKIPMSPWIPTDIVYEVMSHVVDTDTRRNLHLAWAGIFDIPYIRRISCNQRSSFESKYSHLPRVEYIVDENHPPGSDFHQPDFYEIFFAQKGFMYSIEYSPELPVRTHHIKGTRFCRNGWAHDTSYTLDVTTNAWKSDYDDSPECGPGCQELQRTR